MMIRFLFCFLYSPWLRIRIERIKKKKYKNTIRLWSCVEEGMRKNTKQQRLRSAAIVCVYALLLFSSWEVMQRNATHAIDWAFTSL